MMPTLWANALHKTYIHVQKPSSVFLCWSFLPCGHVLTSRTLNMCCCCLTHTLSVPFLKHTFTLLRHLFIITPYSYLKPSSISLHFVSSMSLVSPYPLQLQDAVPLIWPSVHLTHLFWLQSEDQEDCHGSVQVTNALLSASLLAISVLLSCLFFFSSAMILNWCMTFLSTLPEQLFIWKLTGIVIPPVLNQQYKDGNGRNYEIIFLNL